MTTTELKKKIHKVVDGIDDAKLLEAVFTILNANAQPDEYSLSDEDLRIIEERKIEYKSGETKVYTVEEVKKKILKNLGK
ncbi:hypothetical protein CNR22_02200 [Sphingobacteriaceae bacterium]|nr:hypothetical protein CNR22_02200 [Sphingobacteriaceae bacterium]